MATGDIHTIAYGNRWANRVEGEDEDDVSNICDSRIHAVAVGAQMAAAGGTRHLVYHGQPKPSSRTSPAAAAEDGATDVQSTKTTLDHE